MKKTPSIFILIISLILFIVIPVASYFVGFFNSYPISIFIVPILFIIGSIMLVYYLLKRYKNIEEVSLEGDQSNKISPRKNLTLHIISLVIFVILSLLALPIGYSLRNVSVCTGDGCFADLFIFTSVVVISFFIWLPLIVLLICLWNSYKKYNPKKFILVILVVLYLVFSLGFIYTMSQKGNQTKNQQTTARDRNYQRDNNFSVIKNALDKYFQKNQGYPIVKDFSSLTEKLVREGYLQSNLQDPLYPKESYKYGVTQDGLYYKVEAIWEDDGRQYYSDAKTKRITNDYQKAENNIKCLDNCVFNNLESSNDSTSLLAYENKANQFGLKYPGYFNLVNSGSREISLDKDDKRIMSFKSFYCAKQSQSPYPYVAYNESAEKCFLSTINELKEILKKDNLYLQESQSLYTKWTLRIGSDSSMREEKAETIIYELSQVIDNSESNNIVGYNIVLGQLYDDYYELYFENIGRTLHSIK